MVHQAKAIFLDGVNPHARAGRLVYDAVHQELHFYEKPADETQGEFFAFSVDKNHVFEIRRRGHEHVIEWRSGAGNYTSAMFVVSDLAFIRLVRDKFLSHKNLFWRYATLVWSESLSRVILALMIGTCITGFGAYTFMQNSYHIVPQAWDQRVGDQAQQPAHFLEGEAELSAATDKILPPPSNVSCPSNARGSVWFSRKQPASAKALKEYGFVVGKAEYKQVFTPYLGGVAQPARLFGADATTRTITGLTRGGAYTFTVRARNARGNGPASVTSGVIRPT